MKKKQGKKLNVVLVLLLGALLLLLPTQVLSKGKPNPTQDVPDTTSGDGICAFTDPNSLPYGDNDLDGFTNQEECEGLVAGETTYDNHIVYLSIPGRNSGVLRENRLDPESKDLFLGVIPLLDGSLLSGTRERLAAGSLSANLPKYDEAGSITGHLGIYTHLLTESQLKALPATREIIAGRQKWLRVTESKDLSGKFGSSVDTNAPPDGKDDIKIFTYFIRQFVNDVFADGVDHPEVWEDINDQVFCHEAFGHGIKVYPEYNARYDGYHLRPGTGFMMEEAMKVQGTEFYPAYLYIDKSVLEFQLVAGAPF